MASDVERIKEKLPIEEIIGSYVKLDKSSGRLKGRCPFHSEKSPSFFVSPERGTYYCFGCGVKGDIFTFVQEFEKLDFKGALKILADRAGIELLVQSREERDETDMLYEVLEKATLYYQKQLAERKDVIAYLTGRGLSIATIKSWRIGFAPDEWTPASTALIGKGFAPKLIEKAGLTKPSDKKPGEYYDRFRSRIMFPLTDTGGRVIGFSGRIFGPDTEMAKYLNSPETELFDKSSFLYGFDRAKFDIRKKNEVILVEGQMDLIMSHQAGFTNTVAVSGTALSEKHVDILKRFSQTLFLAFDADSAGQKASERSATIALSKDMEVKVIRIDGGKDPADVIKESPDLWKQALEKPLHIIEAQLARAMQEKEPRARARAIEELVLPYIAVLPSPLQRAHFISTVGYASGMSDKSLEEALKSVSVVDIKNTPHVSVSKQQSVARIDTVHRRVAALLLWLRQKNNTRPDVDSAYVEQYVKEHTNEDIAGTIAMLTKQYEAELLYEADAAFSGVTSLRKEVDEILSTLSEEHLKKRLAETMALLKRAEGEQNKVEVDRLLKVCHELSGQLHKLKNNIV